MRVIGADNIKSARDGTLIVANHVSHFDALILYLFLPQPIVFALAPSTVLSLIDCLDDPGVDLSIFCDLVHFWIFATRSGQYF